MTRGRATLARYAAPAAFLLAVTVAVLIIRAGLSREEGATPPAATPTVTAQSPTPGPGRATTAPGTRTAAAARFYEIEAGDTLAVVADRFDTTVEQLLVLNPEIDPVSLRIGQRIRVK